MYILYYVIRNVFDFFSIYGLQHTVELFYFAVTIFCELGKFILNLKQTRQF